ncbi:MAG: hypothetical protein OXL68_03050 [Paracoccaceae bacterium]|nr:hypothetical protein [Paracoccaceae bacterium]
MRRDRRVEIEQRPYMCEEVILVGVLMSKELVGGTEERHNIQSAEIDPEHLAGRTVPAQPAVACPTPIQRPDYPLAVKAETCLAS